MNIKYILYDKTRIEKKKNLTGKSAASGQIDENNILEDNNPIFILVREYLVVVPEQVINEVITSE